MCMGEEAIISGEAHCRASIELPGAQNDLIKEIAKTGKPIILVVLAGRPLAIGPESDLACSVLYAFHTGTMTGSALADLLMGEVSPSGKLPVTFPKTSGQIPIYYNKKNTGRPVDPNNWMSIDDIPLNTNQTSLGNTSHYLDLGYEPLYHFGYGLTYTQFQYANLALSTKELKMNGKVEITADIQNTGNFEAQEIVQLYVRDKVGSITRPVKELKGFEKIHLKPGELKTVTFEITAEDLQFFNGEEYLTEPGDFDVWVAPNSIEGLQGTFLLK